MRVFVTGATGFVGGHVVERLVSAGHEVVAAVRRPGEVRGARAVPVDFADVGSLVAAADGCDAVIHAAGSGKPPGGEDPDVALWRQNVDVTARLLEATRDRRFVFVSSIAAQGPSPDGRRPTAETPLRPTSAYGRSKVAAEALVAEAPNAAILRPPPVYGPRDPNFLPLFRAARRGIVPLVARDATTNLVHVGDLADALVAAAASDVRGAWFVDDGRVHAWGEIADALGAAMGRRVRSVPVPLRALGWAAVVAEAIGARRGGVVFLSRDKVRDMAQRHWLCGPPPPVAMGWAPRWSLAEGLADTAAAYRSQGDL